MIKNPDTGMMIDVSSAPRNSNVSGCSQKVGLVVGMDVQRSTRATANDPKLSDRGARRGTCMVGGKAAAEAGAVTCGAVRCSAWLGDVGCACEVIVWKLNQGWGRWRDVVLGRGPK